MPLIRYRTRRHHPAERRALRLRPDPRRACTASGPLRRHADHPRRQRVPLPDRDRCCSCRTKCAALSAGGGAGGLDGLPRRVRWKSRPESTSRPRTPCCPRTVRRSRTNRSPWSISRRRSREHQGHRRGDRLRQVHGTGLGGTQRGQSQAGDRQTAQIALPGPSPPTTGTARLLPRVARAASRLLRSDASPPGRDGHA